MTNETQSVAEALNLLRALQTADNELRDLDQLLKAKPQELDIARDRVARQEQAMTGLHQDAKKVQAEIDGLELELKAGEEKIANLRLQQNEAKNNRQYKAFQDEIDNIRNENSLLEDQILELMARTEAGAGQEAKARRNVEEEQRRMAEAQDSLEAEIQQISAEHEETTKRHEELARQVERKYLAQYMRLVRNRDGVAVVPVRNGTCSGCFINLPPQTINALMGEHELVFCHSCGRILFLDSVE